MPIKELFHKDKDCLVLHRHVSPVGQPQGGRLPVGSSGWLGKWPLRVVRSCDLAAAENTVYKSMLAKTSYIANCFYSAARVRRSHRQGRAGGYPVMLMGTTLQQDVAPCTVTGGSFRRLASCYLHVCTVVSFCLYILLIGFSSSYHHVCSQPFCVFACFSLLFLWPASCYLHVCVVYFSFAF